VDPAARDNEAFRLACANGYIEVVVLLLSLSNRGVDPAAHDNEAFRLACDNGRIRTVQLLLQYENIVLFLLQKWNSIPEWFFGIVLRTWHKEVISLYIENENADSAERFAAAMYSASQNGYAEIVKLFLECTTVENPYKADIFIQ
jgi:ankyrin repeat protein